MTARSRTAPRTLHYGWVILALSTLTVMGSLGFARFGYTMILPAMQESLELSNTQTGALATGNFLGYLVLAATGGYLASRYGPRRVIGISMLVTGATMALTGLTNGFQSALVCRILTGAGSGGSNVPAMSLLPAWFSPKRRGLATGVAVGGSSLALIITGPLVPRILNTFGEDGWRYSWYVLGAAILLLALLAYVFLRDRPEEKGLQPISAASEVRSGEETDTSRDLTDEQSGDRASSLDWGRVYRSGAIWHLALVYVAFGLSYVIFTTFFARYLQTEGGYTREASGNLWAMVGWISVFCGLIWGAVSDLIGRKYALALVYVIQAVSYAIFATWSNPTGYTVSAVGFGLTAWSVPSIVAATCGDYVGARMAPAALGFVTLFFGLGQAMGPSVAGALADATGSFAPAFLFASGVASLGIVGSLLLRPPRSQTTT